MQGRLSTPVLPDRLQFFQQDWYDEFILARQLGFDSITWFLDRDIDDFDPINDIWLKETILSRIDQARIITPINSIDCGKYPFFGPKSKNTINDFNLLIPVLSGRLSSATICIPMLEENAPKSDREIDESQQNIIQLVSLCKKSKIRIALETEMSAPKLIEYLNVFDPSVVGICYDIGNCTSYGFDCPNEINMLGKKIFEVHVKDRKIGGNQSMFLGKGDADFDGCIKSLKNIMYTGMYTMQAWRGHDYINDARSQLDFIKHKLM